MTRSAALEQLAHQRDRREDSFLRTLQHTVFENPASPYLALLIRAGITCEDIRDLVRRDGVEGALGRLFEAGVYVTLDEFKGVKPIRRGDFELPVLASDFDTPMPSRAFEVRGGGTRSRGRRMAFDFDHLIADVPAHALLMAAFGLERRPMVLWRPVPPAAAGLRRALIHAKCGGTTGAWFTQSPLPGVFDDWKRRLVIESLVLAGRGLPGAIPRPRHVGIGDPALVARHLAAMKETGRPAHFQTSVSSAVRVVAAAAAEGLDLSGTFMGVGGEPLTDERAGRFEASGCVYSSFYSMTECGQVGVGCGDRREPDEVHLLDGKAALIRRTRPSVGRDAPGGLYCTTLLSSSPKVLLNAETGDDGVLETRRCGCVAGAVGLNRHLRHIRSYEKLTIEGMNIATDRILALIEHALPGRFGGTPTDYQFVEDRRGAVSRMHVVVSLRVGKIDEGELISFVLEHWRSSGSRMTADYLGQAGALVVTRREPYVTASAKIAMLHVID